jgi:hypothetical protein
MDNDHCALERIERAIEEARGRARDMSRRLAGDDPTASETLLKETERALSALHATRDELALKIAWAEAGLIVEADRSG